MCGIWARTRFDAAVDPAELLFPVRQLAHRGPDGYGWYADAGCALLHTRLSIIDLSGGSQPLESFDGRWVGIVNGELYDFEAIREELRHDGVSFRTRSDSEALLNLFASRGAHALNGLSGEFAFVFYDRVGKRLVFGRDPMGVKPLFFDRRDDVFTLASETKALGEATPEFDPGYLNTFLAHMMEPPRTALANAHHIWPGRVYTLDLKTRELRWERYADLPLFRARTLAGPEAEARVETALRASIRRRLRADVEVGTYLSGGIDSALVAALASEEGAAPHAFTVGFNDRDFDESSEAARIASDLGLRHSMVQLTARNFMPSLIRSIVAFENPITNPHGAAKNLLASLAGQIVRVVLSGEGADECFGGYAYLRVKKLKSFVARHPSLGRNAIASFLARERLQSLKHLDGASTAHDAMTARHFGGFSPVLFGRLVKSRWYRHLTRESLADRASEIAVSLARNLMSELPAENLDDWDLNAWLSFRVDLLHYILANVGDRQEMSHSIEGRTPFLDPQVLDVAGRIRENSLLRGLREKHVLRKIAGRRLHRDHSHRVKKPFFAPIKYLYLRENREAVEFYLGRAEEAAPWLDWRHIRHVLRSDRRQASSALEGNIVSLRLTLFSLGVLREHLRKTPSLPEPRGFKIPLGVSELAPYRKSVS